MNKEVFVHTLLLSMLSLLLAVAPSGYSQNENDFGQDFDEQEQVQQVQQVQQGQQGQQGQQTQQTNQNAENAAQENLNANVPDQAYPPLGNTQEIPVQSIEQIPDLQENPISTNSLLDTVEPITGEDALGTPAEAAPVDVGPIAPPPLPVNQFAGAPAIPGTLRNLAEGEAPEEFLIQKGDTLFDVCDQLLDEPGYWPKLWAMNPEIKNPHFIYPGMKLRFYPGDAETPPYLQVVSEQDIIPLDKGALNEAQLVAEDVFIKTATDPPPPTEVIGPEQLEVPMEILDGFITAGKVYDRNEMMLEVPGFLYEEEKEPLGTVLGGSNGQHLTGTNEEIIIEPEEDLTVGTTYSVVRYAGKVYHPTEGDFVGYRYDFVGNIKVMRKNREDLFVASVANTRLGVATEDMLVPYISTRREIINPEVLGSLGSSDAVVVGFEYEGQLTSGGTGLVFLSKGSSGAISPGQFYPVYQDAGYSLIESLSDWTADIPESEPAAILRIIDSTDAGAVGVIVRTKTAIYVGSRLQRDSG